jgi:hypothetical protein
LRIGILVAAFLVLILWSQPTAWVVLGLALVVGLLLVLVELLGRPPPHDEAGDGRQDTPAEPTGADTPAAAAPSPGAKVGD